MTDMFEEVEADLSGVTHKSEMTVLPLFESEFTHKEYIEEDEGSTDAAAPRGV